MMKQIAVVVASVLAGVGVAVLLLDRDGQQAKRGVDVEGPAPVVPVDQERVSDLATELAAVPSRVSADIPSDTPSIVEEGEPAQESNAPTSISDVELEALVRTQEPFAADDSNFEKKYASFGVEELHRAKALVGRFAREEQDLVLPSVFAKGNYSTPPVRDSLSEFYRVTAAPDGKQVKVYFDPIEFPFIDMRGRERVWLIMRIRALGGDPGKYNTSRQRG